MKPAEPAAPSGPDASLIDGGPVFAMCAMLGMSPIQPGGAVRLAAAALALTWVPMVALAAAQGLALPGMTPIPLLLDPTVWARIVIGLPALIIAGPIIASRTAPAIQEFRRLVPDSRRDEFETALRGLVRLSQSWIPDVVVLGIAAITSWLAIHAGLSGPTGDWRTMPSSGSPSMARIWSVAVALPIFQFLVMRWGWRILLWWRFLAIMARMDLQLLATHPDGFAGLGFLGEAQSAFFMLASPLSLIFSTHVVVAAMHNGEDLKSYNAPTVTFVVLCALALMGPALSFLGLLVRARRRAIFEYGRLGQSYVSQFDRKWVSGNPPDEPLLGTGDIQSLADIANSMRVVREMKVIPYEHRHLILFAACLVLPVLPPLLMVMPLTAILARVASIVAK